MFHKVKSVQPLPEYHLDILFVDGTRKLYSVSPLFDRWSAFCSLRDVPGLFDQVKVDTGGYGVVWNPEIDLSCNELWYGGQ